MKKLKKTFFSFNVNINDHSMHTNDHCMHTNDHPGIQQEEDRGEEAVVDQLDGESQEEGCHWNATGTVNHPCVGGACVLEY